MLDRPMGTLQKDPPHATTINTGDPLPPQPCFAHRNSGESHNGCNALFDINLTSHWLTSCDPSCLLHVIDPPQTYTERLYTLSWRHSASFSFICLIDPAFILPISRESPLPNFYPIIRLPSPARPQNGLGTATQMDRQARRRGGAWPDSHPAYGTK